MEVTTSSSPSFVFKLKGLKSYWGRRRLRGGGGGYRRLNGSTRPRRNRVELASGIRTTTRRRGRFWRIKITPKIKSLRIILPNSTKKFLVWLRDAYVKMMMSFANSRVVTSGYGGSSGVVNGGFGRGPLKEYDEKMLVQIYKSLLMAQPHPADMPIIRR